MAKLSNASLLCLPADVRVPRYDRSKLSVGVVHLSVGNFHRAHQAAFVDRVLHLEGNENWAICGVGVMDTPAERTKAAGMTAQDCLYTLTECAPGAPPAVSVIGSIVDYVFAPAELETALTRMCEPGVCIVTLTITEGGYNMTSDGSFRLDAPDVAADLSTLASVSDGCLVPRLRTVFGIVTEALARRRASGAGPFTVLSCDNLKHNGAVAKKAFLSFARARDAALAAWIEQHVTFPGCMVDRIAPATLDADVTRLNAYSGIADRVPVFSEDFIQWIVEDNFCAGRPPLELVGVTFTSDVDVYEQMKLRMLNGSHNCLSFPALLAGHRMVHEAMADSRFSSLLSTFMEHDVIPLLKAPPGVDLHEYKALLLRRFSNTAIADQIMRIAGDGAAKLPVFIQDTARSLVALGRDHRRVAFVLASFVHYLHGSDDEGRGYSVFEPNLTKADLALVLESDHPEDALNISTFTGWGIHDSDAFRSDFVRYRTSIASKGVRATLDEFESVCSAVVCPA